MKFADRTQVAVTLSVLILAMAILMWPDIFLFSRVYNRPSWFWLKWVPSLYTASDCIGLLGLIPAAILPPTLHLAGRALTTATFVVPVTAVLVFVGNNRASSSALQLISNALFNYAWVLGTTCLIPALLLFTLRAAASFLVSRMR
jgi:hypothetical protein